MLGTGSKVRITQTKIIILICRTVDRIKRLCPNLISARLLMDDLYYRELDTLTMLEEVTLFRRKEMKRY